MRKLNYIHFLLLSAIFLLVFSSCRKDELVEDEETEDLSNYPDWTDATHSNNVDPDYSTVFNQSEVLRFDISISSDDWSNMQSDLASVAGGKSTPGSVDVDDPMWVKCSFKFNDKEWYNVGVRYKGNSSLRSAYNSGNSKLSLKLDFDEFEDDYPALKNQRFYGFKQLNLNNNYDDASLMREKVGADLFRQFGLASANTAFCVVYLDNGSGPKYYGVYTIVEEVDDTVIDTQFASGDGNLYKPDGDAASFASGTFNTSEMELKTNEETADYSDVQALYDVINSSDRTSNTSTWKTNLENVLNVDNFLKYLAANTIIQNWDTYGRMTHNYYLYNNPENNLLTWIPWDNNEAFQQGKQGGSLSLALSEVNSSWPLISYIIDQSDYETTYKQYLEEFITNVFIPNQMSTTYSQYYDMLKEYAYAEESGYTFIKSDSDFDQAVETMKSHAQSRTDAVNDFLK